MQKSARLRRLLAVVCLLPIIVLMAMLSFLSFHRKSDTGFIYVWREDGFARDLLRSIQRDLGPVEKEIPTLSGITSSHLIRESSASRGVVYWVLNYGYRAKQDYWYICIKVQKPWYCGDQIPAVRVWSIPGHNLQAVLFVNYIASPDGNADRIRAHIYQRVGDTIQSRIARSVSH